MQPSFRLLPLCLALAALPGPASAGEPAVPTPGDLARYDRNRDGRLDATELAAKASADALAAGAVTLTPFEVSADAFDTYEATNTNSITGTNTPLGKTPLDAKVFNRQLMDEMGVVDMTEMLSKLGGLGSAIIGGGNEDVRGDLEGDRQDPKSMTMRGLQINNPRRDGFLRSDTTLLDSFDIERVEAIGGSNSLLFGSGDAGGVVTSASKRAYVNRGPRVTFAATGDSEGTRRFTLDAGAGYRTWGYRINAVRGDTRYFRPGTRQINEGLHLALTLQPWRRLQIRGEWRHFTRDTIFAQAVTVRAPLNLLLPTGERVDGQSSRYLVAFPNVRELTGGTFDLTKVDSAIGPFHRDAYKNGIKSVVAEATLAEGLALQVRYGHDARINDPLRANNTTVYAPGAPGNAYVDPLTGLVGTQWAFTTSMNATPFHTGARGYRAALAYQKNLGRWGRHQSSVFFQDMQSWVNQEPWRFYEADAAGRVIQNPAQINTTESGRITLPAVWMPIFPKEVIGGQQWPFTSLVHPNGRTYVYQPQVYAGAVSPTAANPLGLSGPINATTGQSTITGYYHDDTNERSYGFSLFSEWWKGRIDTMAGYRAEEASAFRTNTGLRRGPITYDSLTTGAVIDTPLKGVRVSLNYSTNAKINFDTTRDIYNQPLPPGKGVSRDVGLKFGLWENRISGNLNYYVSEAQNFTAGLGGTQNDVDPNGINGRNGGGAYTYSRTSDGYNLTLSARPLRGWEVRVNLATANGSERSDVILPQFYNDQFNTTTVGGQTVVGVRATAGGAITPLLVPSDPLDPTSAPMPLSLAMLRDPNSAYFAQLDQESGQILNAQALGLLTPGVGTNATGLPVSQHQLGFVSPSGGTLIVRKAGERTIGYAERSYSLINRFQFDQGPLRGLVVGLSSSLREKHRGYMYNDAADGNRRKMYYFPDRMLHDLFALYRLKPYGKVRTTLQLNVSNLLDANEVMYLIRSTNGTLRYAQWLNAPRKLGVTTTVSF